MRLAAVLAVGIAVTVIAGCSPITVSHDYDTKFNFSGLRTFDWLPARDKPSVSQLTLQRIQRAIEDQLEGKGYARVSVKPDFLIAVHTSIEEKVEVRDYGYAMGPYWGGPRAVEVYRHQEGTLLIDFVDAPSKNLFWRGVAQGAVTSETTPEARDARINEAIQKVLANFPPPPATPPK